METPEIDVHQLEQQLAAGATLFDVREVDEFVEAHIDGAELVPLATVPDEIDRFPNAGPFYIICARGGRSGKAVEFLRAQGSEAINVAGGMGAWLEAGKAHSSGHGD